MRTELMDKVVLAMYDIRGIQNYIFATNEVRSIIGASVLVENIITDGLREIRGAHGEWDKNKFIVSWEQEKEIAFLKDNSIQMQVLFIGGGNAYVLFRTGELCQLVNRSLAKYVLEKTYSLSLAVAVVPKTESYLKDYEAINLEMRRVKAFMAPTKPVGSMPFMKADSQTGYPLTNAFDRTSGKQLTTESALKLSNIPKEINKPEKIFDNMVKGKGDNSTLAVIHIDGNSMGSRLKEIMEVQDAYEDAVETMRVISQNIQNSFQQAFASMCQLMDEKTPLVKENPAGKLYRKIITAGDDITFVCNPELALAAVEKYMEVISTMDMYQEAGLSEKENHLKYGFSACAGIAFFNSHFPFSDAYEVAEACCASAKTAAKKKESRCSGNEKGMIGCYVDYQPCTNIRAAQLSEYRERHYGFADRSGLMIQRPYYIPTPGLGALNDLDERNAEKAIDILKVNMKAFATYDNIGKMTQSHAKALRNAFSFGMSEVEKQITFLESRSVSLPDTDPKTWYDALEILDFYKEGV